MKVNKNIKLLYWFNFFNDFRPYAVIAIIYFSHITGSYALGLSIFSIAMFSSAMLELPTGIFSDKVGRKLTIVYGSIASILAITLYAMGGNYWILALGAVFNGLSQSLFSGNNEAFLHDELTEHGQVEKFGEILGKTSSMFQIALSISALIGGFIAAKSLVYVMWLSVIPQVCCLVLSIFMTEPGVHGKIATNIYEHLKDSFKLILNNPRLRLINLVGIISYGIGETMFQFGPVFIALLWPVWALGIYRMLDNGIAALGFWFSGRLLKKYDGVKLLIAGKFYSGLAGIFAVAYPTIVSPFLLATNSFFFGTAHTTRGKLMQQEYTDTHRATMGSLSSFAGSIFMAIFALLFGLAADKIGPVKSLLIGEVLVFATIVFYIRLLKYYPKPTI